MLNYFLPFKVKILDAHMLDISINSPKNQFNSSPAPFPVSLIRKIHTLNSLADFNEWVKKFIKSFNFDFLSFFLNHHHAIKTVPLAAAANIYLAAIIAPAPIVFYLDFGLYLAIAYSITTDAADAISQ